MEKVDTPVLFINSKNDPISLYDNIPFDILRSKRNFFSIVTPKGGHLNYYTKGGMKRWNVEATSKYIDLIESQTKLV